MSIKTCPNCFESMNCLVRTRKLTVKTIQQSQGGRDIHTIIFRQLFQQSTALRKVKTVFSKGFSSDI